MWKAGEMGMKCIDRKYLLKEAKRTLDESDSTAAFCLCQRWILKDAIALLKEQEAIKPRSVVRHGANAQIQHFCGNCNTMLHGKPNYCSECGKEILW